MCICISSHTTQNISNVKFHLQRFQQILTFKCKYIRKDVVKPLTSFYRIEVQLLCFAGYYFVIFPYDHYNYVDAVDRQSIMDIKISHSNSILIKKQKRLFQLLQIRSRKIQETITNIYMMTS